MLTNFRPRPVILMMLAVAIVPQLTAEAVLKLDLGEVAGSAGETVEVPVTLSGSPGASTIVFGVAFDWQALQFVSVQEGSALSASQWVEQGTVSGGVAPIAVSSLGGEIGSGEVCILSFRILSYVGGVEDLRSSGTPSAANVAGAVIAVEVVGGEVVTNCMGSEADTPSGVTASTDEASGVLVSWNGSAGATAYRVYRAGKATPDAVEAVSDWMVNASSWLDTSAAEPGVLYTGCQGGGNDIWEVKYFYWVRARDEWGCPSDYSEPAEGWRTPEKAAVSAGLAGGGGADVLVLGSVAVLLLLGTTMKRGLLGQE